MEYRGLTDKGIVRSSNQDNFAAGKIGETVWAVVCDGMGGVSGGNIASSIAVERIKTSIENSDIRTLNEQNAQNLFRSAFCAANVAVYEKAVGDTSLFGMGTTAVAVIVGNGVACVAHVGDSRAYLISGGSITGLTTDHSLVQAMVERGEITEEEAKTHKHKHMITRAIGVGVDVEVDFCQTEVSGGYILLCTDGLTNCVSDERIMEIVEKNGLGSPEILINEANSAGGYDNITAVVIEC